MGVILSQRPPSRIRIARSCVLLLIARACCAAQPSEYQIKTVFLLDFAQLVEWPASAFAGPAAPFVIGVLGQDPFGPQLDMLVRDKAIHARSIVIERYRDIDELHHCNILFIGQSQLQELPRILKVLTGRSILTVSDAEAADQSGVMVRLITRSSRIRLRIDMAAAKAGRLVISSRLLRLAETVERGNGLTLRSTPTPAAPALRDAS